MRRQFRQSFSGNVSRSTNEDEEADPRSPMLELRPLNRGRSETTGEEAAGENSSRGLIVQNPLQSHEPETWSDSFSHHVGVLGSLNYFEEALRELGDDAQADDFLKARRLVELRWSGIVEVAADADGSPADNGDRDQRGSVTELRTFQERTTGTVLHFAAALGHLDIVKYLVETRNQSVNALSDSGSTPICLAVAHSHLPVVDFLLRAGARLDVRDKASRTFLHYAVLSGSHNTVSSALQMLKEQIVRKNVTKLFSQAENILMLATRYGLCDVVQVLLGDISMQYILSLGDPYLFHGDTPLHVTCSRNDAHAINVINQLLDANMNWSSINEDGKTPFMLAAEVGAVDIIAILSQHYSGRRGNMDIPYLPVADNHYFPVPHISDPEEKRTLVKLSYLFAVRQKNGKSTWEYAIELPSNDVFRALLNAAWLLSGVPVPEDRGHECASDSELTGQAAAIESDLEDTMMQKLQYFVIVRDGNESTTPLHMAASKGDVEKLKIMLQYGFRLEKMLDSTGNTFLHTAAREGQVEVVRNFATKPVYVNQRNKNGDNVLSVACSAGQHECIRLLLPNADTSLVNEQGRTALHELCVRADLPFSLLRDVVLRSADQLCCGVPIIFVLKDKTGRNALHLLAGNPKLVQRESTFKLFYCLLMWNPVRDDVGKECRQPLQEALYNRCVDNALALMKTFGSLVGVNAVDGHGLTSLHVAVQQCLPQAVRPLIESGADLSYRDVKGNSPLHTLVTFASKQPELQDEYIKLLREILDCAVIWHCKKIGEPVLSKKSDHYQNYHKKAVIRLLTKVYNCYQMNVVMWAAYKCFECKELLTVLLTVPDVFCWTSRDPKTPHKKNTEYTYYDVTNIVPVTMVPIRRRMLQHVDISMPNVAERSSGTSRTIETEYTDSNEDDCASNPMTQDYEDSVNEDRLISRLMPLSSLVDIIVGTDDPFREKRLRLLDVSPIREMTERYSRPYKIMSGISMLVHIVYMIVFSIQTQIITASADLSCAYPANETSGYSNVSRIDERTAESGLSLKLLIWPSLIFLSDLLYGMFHFWRSGFKWPHMPVNWSLSRAINTPIWHVKMVHINVYRGCGIAFLCMVVFWYVLNNLGNCYQDYFLAVTMITGWLYTINFTQILSGVYQFSLILQHIVLKDLFKFTFVFASLVVGYAFAFQVLTLSVPRLRQEFPSMEYTLFDVFHWLIGMGEFYKVQPDELASIGKSDTMMKATFVSYVILLNIVLLNLLVAVMNDTFSSIYRGDPLAWQVRLLQNVLDIENHYLFVGSMLQNFRITRSRWLGQVSYLAKVLCCLRGLEIVTDASSMQKRFLLKVRRDKSDIKLSEKNATPGKGAEASSFFR